MNVAAIQMCAELGNVAENLRKAERLLEEAFRKGAKWAILPEFFASGVGFHSVILKAALPLEGPALSMMRNMARKYSAVVGGSFICRREDDNYNTFCLVFPDGKYVTHDKDIPTMWENCYYRSGNDDGILDTPVGKVGAALCWEYVRTQTARRLVGKVEMVVGGTCWWDIPRGWGLPKSLSDGNRQILHDTPSRFARMVGAPVIHASHAGKFVCNTPWLPGVRYESHFLGETQIVDGRGNILARLKYEDGEGVITGTVTPSRVEPTERIPERFWIPDLPWLFRFVWSYQNLHGRRYYRKMNEAGLLTTSVVA
ncbi:MAG: carbon-nitrogen hydrolase family protein [Candidatus Lindowbacteria bacterium]|nr:carbon-nitrogen hydrolase family protein [Candidatus Lindowbacteria bacterium]